MENKNQEEALIIEVSTITYIDLASSDLHQSSVLLKQACSDSGFFCHKSWYKRGIERPRFRAEQEVLHPSFGREDEGDYKEGFTIGTEGPKKGPHHDKTLYSPNIWPNPDVLPRWWETMEKYYQKALRVCKSIARIMALALDLDVNYFDTPDMLRNPIADMILFHCEGVSNPSKGIYACGAHCDFGMLSLLATDDVMGLQICKDKDLKPQKWKYVPSIKGAYIVNLGNLLERWSNGFYNRSVLIAVSFLPKTEPRLYNRVSSYLPVRKQATQISCDQMLNVPLPTLQSRTYTPQADLGEVYHPPGPHP
ncbi:unnamed protein product [Brassica oleracea var. botrytis]